MSLPTEVSHSSAAVTSTLAHSLSIGYFLVDKVDEMDARLKELQAEDEEDDSESEPESSSSSVSPTQRRNPPHSAVQRPTRSVRREESYREESEEEEEPVFKIGPRVQAFVKKREKYVEKVDSVSRCSRSTSNTRLFPITHMMLMLVSYPFLRRFMLRTNCIKAGSRFLLSQLIHHRMDSYPPEDSSPRRRSRIKETRQRSRNEARRMRSVPQELSSQVLRQARRRVGRGSMAPSLRRLPLPPVCSTFLEETQLSRSPREDYRNGMDHEARLCRQRLSRVPRRNCREGCSTHLIDHSRIRK